MDWELVRKLLNLVGVVLEFASFWFAAPEILGEQRLRALERGLEKGIKLLPGAVVGVGLLLVSMVLGAAMIEAGLPEMLAGLLLAVLKAWQLALLAAVVVVIVVGLLLTVLMTLVAVAVAIKLREKVVTPWLRRLADDERIRQRSLAVGAVLFVIAFLCQFTAALLDILGL